MEARKASQVWVPNSAADTEPHPKPRLFLKVIIGLHVHLIPYVASHSSVWGSLTLKHFFKGGITYIPGWP